ncbi:MAG: cysteine--tRNA ligase [Erysipelotrichaceae bacterium]
MKLYNAKSLKVETFVPIKENKVSMYVCGPTVYGHAHIGNARPIIVFDTLKRTLEANGYEVKYVSNFTDVDDKIIKKAIEEQTDEFTITNRYIDAYNDVRKALNTKPLYSTPKVTETMDAIVAFIEELVEKGNAYDVDGDVYFSVDSIEGYGEISKQNVDDLKVGARIESNQKKKNPLDFALWKKTDMGIKWPSKFSMGRPGWHSECVVMIHQQFKGMIDIHGGGMDLKFPHHENEVAQSKALYHNSIANYWVHNAMINIDGEKMSKSLGNIRNAKDVIAELGAQLVRFLTLSVHYRKELNFTMEAIDTARKELDKIMVALKQGYIQCGLSQTSLINYDEESYQAFLEAMNDDLNTPNAYTVIYDTVKKLNQSIRVKEKQMDLIASYVVSIEKMLDILGIQTNRIEMDDEARSLYQSWNDAKAVKDFEKADTIRTVLTEKGLI